MTGAKQLETAKKLIRAAFVKGLNLTTYTGNKIGHTVDFRKIVSRLREEGFAIKDHWEKASDGRKYKVYYHEKQGPKLEEGNIIK